MVKYSDTEKAAILAEAGIASVHYDNSRTAIYGGFVWKVEYTSEYSHAHRWFKTEEEAWAHAAEEAARGLGITTNGRRAATTVSYLEHFAKRHPIAQEGIERNRLRNGLARHRAHRKPLAARAA